MEGESRGILLYTMLCLLLYLDLVVLSSSPVSSQDLLCSLPRDYFRDLTPCLGVSVFLE